MISWTDDLRKEEMTFEMKIYQNPVGLEFYRNKCFLQRVNTRAFVPREASLELDGFDRLATTACAGFRDDVVLERSGPGGRNPPEILVFLLTLTITDCVDVQHIKSYNFFLHQWPLKMKRNPLDAQK